MKEMKILKVDSVDLERDTCILSDDKSSIDIGLDGDVAVIPGQYWLVDMDEYALVVECPTAEIDVVSDGKNLHYVYGEDPREIPMKQKKDATDAGVERDNVKDVFEVEQIMKKDVSFESHHVLASGQHASIQAKIVGHALHQYCPELGVLRISPLTPEILKRMVSLDGEVIYYPAEHVIAFGNGNHAQINESEVLKVFDDMVIRATRSTDHHVVGTIQSSYIANSPEIHVGIHTGGYSIDPSQSNIIYPEVEYAVGPYMQSRISFTMEPVPYEVFKDCVERYVVANPGLDDQKLVDYLDQEYVNLDGVPISLSIEDRTYLRERYGTPQLEECIEYDRR